MDADKGDLDIRLHTGTYTNEDGEHYTAYGVDVYSAAQGRQIFSAEDLSSDRDAVEAWIRTLRQSDVSPVHFPDLVEDFLT